MFACLIKTRPSLIVFLCFQREQPCVRVGCMKRCRRLLWDVLQKKKILHPEPEFALTVELLILAPLDIWGFAAACVEIIIIIIAKLPHILNSRYISYNAETKICRIILKW